MNVGAEWFVDADGCSPELLRDLLAVQALCDVIIKELDLHVVGQPMWHQFPGPGGVTGLYLLTESHLACHTYPEAGSATFNLYCCQPRPHWPWGDRLLAMLGAKRVTVRFAQRGESTRFELQDARLAASAEQ
ncbi:MAG TPA: S-adenosylmethionine decarboxylase [Blastocatellia bacterium]|nr:S-adenosylmethionine decarboxylase [Blastocatellia bacterium]